MSSFTIRGPMAFEERHAHYQDADALVFAASRENVLNILLEAMAAGLHIACSDRGPMPEILGDCGEYFDPQGPANIAGALRGVLEDDARAASMAARVVGKAEAYSWELCATQTFEFLHGVCRASRSG
ncbi:MAG TPA: glycosyltransferase [Gammaproteobacteria bacterium]|nr:glycosyltransferase [Gammaproteobacteria bacterium]